MKQYDITKANYLGSILAKKINNQKLEPNEEMALNEWMSLNEKNRTKHDEIISCNESEVSELLSIQQESIDENCNQLMLRISNDNKKRIRRRWLLTTSATAAAVFIFFMTLPIKTINILSYETTQQKSIQNDTCVYLISESRKTIHPISEEFRLDEIKEANQVSPSITAPVEMNIIVVPQCRSYGMTLSDGTKVWINACSQIRFPERFANDKRVVEVEGEVYFDVTRDEKRPFIVQTANFTTEVLGTSFLVSSYKNSDTGNISLISGKVNVYNGNNSITLSKGKGVMINALTNQFEECDIDMNKISSLLENKFIFINCRLDSIMSEVSRWYGVEVYFENEALRELQFYIKTDKTNSIDQFMRWMSRTNNINYELKNNLLTIKQMN